MKIKITHVTQSLGGVKTYLESVFTYSDSEKYQYVVIAPEHSELQELCREKSVKYYPVNIKRSINPFNDIRAFFSILSILRAEKPDIVHTHSAKGGYIGRMAARFINAQVIYEPHAFSYLSFHGLKRMIFYSLEFIAKKWTDILLTVSFSEANRAIYELGFDEKKVKTILNAVPVGENLPFRNYQRFNRIGMIGRLTYQKNPLLFLEIAHGLLNKRPDLEFSILGAGICDDLAGDINDYLENHGLVDRIKVLSWGDNETSRQFLINTDIFVMTSVFEGLPFSLLEAMALGAPCVVSKVDGNTDVIHNYENGFACLTREEFEEKIELLIDNEELRKKIGQSGYRYVKDIHEITFNIKSLEQLYTALYQGSGSIDMPLIKKGPGNRISPAIPIIPSLVSNI